EESGATTIPAKKFAALVSRFSADEVSLDIDENNHIKIECGTGRFTLLGLPADEFPGAVDISVKKTIRVEETVFKAMLNSITYAVSPDDSRKVLTGILLATQGNMLTMVATDGKRLALNERTVEAIDGDDGECIVPLKAANEARRMIDGGDFVEIQIGEKQCRFIGQNYTLTSKLIDGNYPNFRQVIPTEFKRVVEVPTEPLLQKIEMVSQVLSESSSYVVLSFADNNLTIKGSSSEIGEGSDSVSIEYALDPIDVSFNPGFLADPLKVVGIPAVTLKMNDPFNQVAIEGANGFIYVIMPIRKK
ncbi:MAG: DNA polymerase III subunit beta, partial [Lentisphaeria bacterium]|nr:DNA polymerase III subunit beta [Lentisphaeria bacterium]